MAHCTNSLHCGSRLTSSLEKAVNCSSLSSPEGPHPLWGMSKGEAMRPWMRMSACIQERGCEMLGVDAGES